MDGPVKGLGNSIKDFIGNLLSTFLFSLPFIVNTCMALVIAAFSLNSSLILWSWALGLTGAFPFSSLPLSISIPLEDVDTFGSRDGACARVIIGCT